MKKTILKATPNYSKRTFTIRWYINGNVFCKYRTTQMTNEEFEECEYNTELDWIEFLKTDSYYAIR